MTMPTPNVAPVALAQGESYAWRISFSEYPPSQWTLRYEYVSAAPSSRMTVTGTADGDAHAFAIASAQTAVLPPGQYQWQLWAAKSPESRIIAEGGLSIRQAITGSSPIDARSVARKTYDALSAAILDWATNGRLTQNYEVEIEDSAQKLARYSLDELRALHAYYQRIVAAEERARRVREGKSPFVDHVARYGR